MPLIPPERSTEKKLQLRFRLSQELLEQMDAYCKWAEIRKKDYLIEHAIRYVLQHDGEWQEYQRKQNECVPKSKN